MHRPAPAFPAFDDWKRMSEREQDALLDRLEAEKRRGAFVSKLLIGVAFATAAVAAVVTLLTLG